MSIVHVDPPVIAYAPALLDDELMYSWLCRLAVLNGWGTGRDAVRKIFGGMTVTPCLTIPTYVSLIKAQCAGSLPYDSIAEFIEVSTLLPYHRPFLDSTRYAQLVEDSLACGALEIQLRLGLIANRFGIKAVHKFCPACVTEDIQANGCYYWHRLHHLPGVDCCVLHAIRLQSHNPPSPSNFSQCFVYPGTLTCSRNFRTTSAQQRQFAQLSSDLVKAALPPINNVDRSNVYRNRILAEGFLTRRGNPDYVAITAALRNHFSDFADFEHQARLLATQKNPLRWIEDLVERPHQSAHPICHILLIDFLFGSIAAFGLAVDAERSIPENSQEIAHLINRARVQEPLQLSGGDIEKLLRDPTLSCRQIAQQAGRSVGTIVKYRRQRGILFKERSKFVDSHFRESIQRDLQSDLPLNSIARAHGVSISTVYRELAYAKFTSLLRQNLLLTAQKEVRRNRWALKLKAAGSDVSRARSANASDYAWLYRHDRNWLLACNAQFHKSTRMAVMVDWKARDQALCLKLLTIADSLSKIEPPIRVSVTRLRTELGQTAHLRRKNMPQLSALLLNLSETPEDFRIRRVNYAIDFLRQKGAEIKLWRVQRAAGLRLWPEALILYTRQRIDDIN